VRPPQWDELERRLQRAAPVPAFDPSSWDGLGEPVGRYLRAAIAEGTPLCSGARLRMHGSIRLGRWLPFRAEQILAPRAGTVWSARVAGVISGSDQYLDGSGAMDWRLFGRVPVMSASGDDVTRSAAGRVAGESIWVPTALLADGIGALRSLDDDKVGVRLVVGAETIGVTHRIAEDGRILTSEFQRWGDPDRTGSFGWHRFGVEATGWRSFGGVTIPHEGRAGWHIGTSRWSTGEFFRFAIDRYALIAPGASVETLARSA
jgi:hypothetical protein